MTKRKDPKDKLRTGRPTKYKPEYDDLAFKFCLLGATDEQLAEYFDTTTTTLNAWKKAHPEFLASMKKGKDEADAEIARALYHRAKGYSHPEEKIFNDGGEIVRADAVKHYPPDTAAAFIWLKNRQGAHWRDKQELELTVSDDVAEMLDAARSRAKTAKP